MKSMAINIEFVNQADGKVGKMLVDDDGVKYELNKVNDTTSKIPKTEIKPSKDILSSYVGKYELIDNPKKTIIIELQKDHLVANLLGKDNVDLIFWTPTKFKFNSVIDIAGEFQIENGKVTKLIVDQNGKYEWRKVQ